MEYGDIIFDNSSNLDLKLLDTVQRQAAITCTAAYTNTSNKELMSELGWEPLSVRRKHHRVGTFYKMKNKLTPDYLSDLYPPLSAGAARYDLRGSNLSIPFCRTEFHKKSFLPRTTAEWNELPIELQNANSLPIFKNTLRKSLPDKPPPWYQYGSNRATVHLTRIRLRNSGLYYHLFKKRIVDSPLCKLCTAAREDEKHFFLHCRFFNAARLKMLSDLSNLLNVNINSIKSTELLKLLIHGNTSFNAQTNRSIFDIVTEYITSTNRF